VRIVKIGIIGAGYIGGTTARLFVDAGHEVAISNSRNPETLERRVAELGPKARTATPADAARFGDVVLLAIPLKSYSDLPAAELRGKIVIDAMNYYPERDGHYPQLDSGQTTSSEMVAAHLSGARLVKAFNTIWFEHLKSQGRKNAPVADRRAIFIAGDDAEAKRAVSELIAEIGFGAYDMGSLRDGRRQQPGTPVYNRELKMSEAKAAASE
jgi:8-hydroxy-5-deazaflavin:NADPH oxidoreductase